MAKPLRSSSAMRWALPGNRTSTERCTASNTMAPGLAAAVALLRRPNGVRPSATGSVLRFHDQTISRQNDGRVPEGTKAGNPGKLRLIQDEALRTASLPRGG